MSSIVQMYMIHSLFFFFSSRRRHTRLQGDWSSDVCSSDLGNAVLTGGTGGQGDGRTQRPGGMTSPSAVFLGADAGGSHSTVVIGSTKKILGRADGPGAAMRPGGAAKSATVLAETARRAAAQAGLDPPVEPAVVGAAGARRAQERLAEPRVRE